jgi:hypothetical protein
MEIPRHIPLRRFIVDWINTQKYPMAVAIKAGRFSMPSITMVNEPFERVFNWPETLIRGTSVRELFKSADWTLRRILSGAARSMLGRPVEFAPTPLDVEIRFGDKISCIGAGLYLPIEKVTYAFGIFTQIPIKTHLRRPIDFITPAPLPLAPGLIESLGTRPKFIYLPTGDRNSKT